MQKITSKLALCLTLALALTACGSKNKTISSSKENKPQETKPQDAATDKDQDTSCKPGFFGPDCKPCTCSEHGVCNDGKEGDGLCRVCDEGFWGLNCQNECTCEDDEQHFCLDGIDGLGCICEGNFVGDDCDIPIKCNSLHGELDPSTGHCKKDSCQAGWASADCNIEVKCAHGEIDTNNGHCKANSCQTGWDGENCSSCAAAFSGKNCDQCSGNFWGKNCNQEPTCKNGTPSLGPNGNGKCVGACNGHFAGENCTECQVDWTGDNCDREISQVKIGDQIWMKKNMDSTTGKDGSKLTCFADTEEDSDFVTNYGCLYTWEDAMKVCPTGFHLPSKEEFKILLNNVGETMEEQSNNLRSKSCKWDRDYFNSATDKYGFSALSAGLHYNDDYKLFACKAYFWSATENEEDSDDAYDLVIEYGFPSVDLFSNKSDYAFSVRCLKD